MKLTSRLSPRQPSSTLPVASSSSLEAGRVLETMDSYFDRWDRDSNGQISWSEIRQNVAEPGITGGESVALATLYSLVDHDADYRGLERRPPVTADKLYNIYYEYDSYDGVYETEGRPVADAYFEKFQQKLSKAGTELFPQGEVDGLMAAQGRAPSCGFMATTYAQAKKDPRSIKESINQRPDGKLEVKFPGLEKSIELNPVTDTERALFSSAEENGTWITTLEKAWGIQQSKGKPLAAFEQTTYPEDAIVAWTDGEAKTTRIPKKTGELQKGEVPHFLKTTQRALESGHMAIAWTRFEGITGQHFVPGHAYTVTGIDPENGTISLRNPWGHLEPSDDQGKPLDGKDDGLFDFPLQEFHHKFQKIARQTA
jgi:Calpain family cysteine protease